MRLSSLLPLSLLALATLGNASHLQLSSRIGFASSLLNDTKNMEYTNITLNGKPFPDAGSSDLWVSAPVPGAISQNY
ncbi:hypothetical protein JVT61DRAFT_4080 [Boletus reticuloceps]|uniref:Uncharacterized protein n=1 Tax=Boletus reticuloceps TaxID=495285 RepID=A0A8I2YM75_9AGAM|nr:hypothetical protein JVT61DRAFT_4080 [Boletus reticuloceps]